MIDVYDNSMHPIGQMEETLAHLTGQWHKAFHCWVVNGQGPGALLFQCRSSAVPYFPNLLNVTATKHLPAGESFEWGIRAVSEELGIPVSVDGFHPLGYRLEMMDHADGHRNREYQMVYLLRSDLPLSAHRPQVDEVTGWVWLEIPAGLELFAGDRERAPVSGMTWDSAGSVGREVYKEVTRMDFVPRISNYYLTICIMAERLLESRLPISIS
jgi:isopentenyldiphosphate isomerase